MDAPFLCSLSWLCPEKQGLRFTNTHQIVHLQSMLYRNLEMVFRWIYAPAVSFSIMLHISNESLACTIPLWQQLWLHLLFDLTDNDDFLLFPINGAHIPSVCVPCFRLYTFLLMHIPPSWVLHLSRWCPVVWTNLNTSLTLPSTSDLTCTLTKQFINTAFHNTIKCSE